VKELEQIHFSADVHVFLRRPAKYVEASRRAGSRRQMEPASTARQFLTAHDIVSRFSWRDADGGEAQRGILLADDVGLGKTTVAALVAWVFAGSGDVAKERRRVRILAPNRLMVRRWEDELHLHVGLLQKCSSFVDIKESRVMAREGRLAPGHIQVVPHSYVTEGNNAACDLLIVDEAHHAKGADTKFNRALKEQSKHAKRILMLTATPFSIQLVELKRMLELVGCDREVLAAVASYSRALDNLYTGSTTRSANRVASALAAKALAAVQQLRKCVIRHGVDNLPAEHRAFGAQGDWSINVPEATPTELELLFRMDRALKVSMAFSHKSTASVDARFHVGWRRFDEVTDELREAQTHFPEPVATVVSSHITCIAQLRKRVGIHSKLRAVGEAVRNATDAGEKVVLFCHHHAVAQELSVHLDRVVGKAAPRENKRINVWQKSWNDALDEVGSSPKSPHRDAFVEWLCSDVVRRQVWQWLTSTTLLEGPLASALSHVSARHRDSPATIAQAAQDLFASLLASSSSRAILDQAASGFRQLPGATSRVTACCPSSRVPSEDHLFEHGQADTVLAIFNSPFGPDVLIATDALSEGVDLHKYCRHLVHYELDPSPVRTVQRNGRLRRVKCWAAITHQPNCVAYPAFRGTRDHKLVQIMKKRLNNFSLLLGGVRDVDVEHAVGSDEAWRNEVISLAKAELANAGHQLVAIRQ
jgi:ERCC4-related helicase